MKKSIIGALVALFAFTSAFAYDLPKPTKVLRLYPEGQNVDKGIVEDGVALTLGPLESNELYGENEVNDRGNVSNIGDGACIDIFLPKKGNGQMIVVCPGGAYANCSATNEGFRVADWCLKRGIAVCMVLYRMPNGHCKVPLNDVQNAFRYCRAKAEEWGIKQIGVMGFSAGGHLAASASTLFVDEVTRPDFSVLIYPVITFEEFITHAGTRYNLVGPKATAKDVEYYSLDGRVSPKTPQTILFLSGDDHAVLPENSIRYYRAMQRNGVKGEMHIFTSGGHGWGFTTMENSGHDALGDQRANFFETLDRWLAARRKDAGLSK